MSLFEDDQYEWRETYFVMFQQERRPTLKAITDALNELGKGFELRDERGDEEGRFESVTVISNDDYAAMDLSFVAGEEVIEQVEELTTELKSLVDTSDEKKALAYLPKCTARLDVFHFEQTSTFSAEVDEEMGEAQLMDPAALLTVVERLATLCDGVAVDPQSGFLV